MADRDEDVEAGAKQFEKAGNSPQQLPLWKDANKVQLVTNIVLGFTCLLLLIMMSSVLSEVGELREEGGVQGAQPNMGSAWYGNHRELMAQIDGTENIQANSTLGIALLHDPSSLMKPFYAGLWEHFVSQVSQAHCGVATMVTMLNAMNLPREERPMADMYAPYSYFTQENFWNNCTNDVMKPSGIIQDPYGITLEQLSRFLQCYAPSDFEYAGDMPKKAVTFREMVIKHMRADDHYLGVNFHRGTLGQAGGGHHSPIAGYNAEKDMVLMLDVNRAKFYPVWVPLVRMYDAMNTNDSCGMWTQNEDFVPEPRAIPEWQLTGHVCAGAKAENLITRYQDPVCSSRTRGLILTCKPGSAKCAL
mmetsp:Transcript_57954/g.142164  ORF Transcript_57954/g.142164 Transcript_57954/m.142164 type:complete len:361 (-) Transcript_57954:158-1240(-)|eukprot:CAMPEP_0206244622 /NCGR_PEP_ID=MMETSP0047_2-20121206/18259_1 /ASSEMBLY_ACC=CAM_ASM_000192 /TAXON_ID=195065 /ORGANISM="Chroomonas mesostigmatica_cf, Strain CCMP1168" /LENGTH=360 /DNA_ID=CAMNT_0053669861 /DNA_START=142 /DNA_END=1224 /DNA_ORIENTATION=+